MRVPTVHFFKGYEASISTRVSMNVLFIYTNINGAHEETYAFGLASLVAVAKMGGVSL
jgi:hypothetical protein